jgi:hypothetical protein
MGVGGGDMGRGKGLVWLSYALGACPRLVRLFWLGPAQQIQIGEALVAEVPIILP